MTAFLRRSALAAGLLAAALALPASAQTLDLSKPQDVLKAQRKIQCSLSDGKPITYWWEGRVYSRVPGEKDRLLWTYVGTNTRACYTVNDPQRGTGYRMTSKEVLLYLDPETGEIARRWKNPWTGKEVEVLHVANDPVNSGPSFATGRDGKPATLGGYEKDGWTFLSLEVPLFYNNPLGGDYQKYVGNDYQAMEMFNFMMPTAELLDASDTVPDLLVTWGRSAQWLPWMEMGSRSGLMIFHGAGKKIASWDDLPEILKAEMKKNYPGFETPPPADDKRPNETSWTYFKKIIDAKPKAPAAAKE
jgi:hypothetical protein